MAQATFEAAIKAHDAECASLVDAHAEGMAAAAMTHTTDLGALRAAHARELDHLRASRASDLAANPFSNSEQTTSPEAPSDLAEARSWILMVPSRK